MRLPIKVGLRIIAVAQSHSDAVLPPARNTDNREATVEKLNYARAERAATTASKSMNGSP